MNINKSGKDIDIRRSNDYNLNYIIWRFDMDYITIKEASDKWGLSVRRVQTLCSEEQIAGAIRFSGVWAIPSIAEKPVDKIKR